MMRLDDALHLLFNEFKLLNYFFYIQHIIVSLSDI
ncbi:hypothetical protein DESC_930006 [Desulfosarcina cetonica]|nr:hypothetical protein DESC_930006 [Desulfosarcina cetonica]